MLFRNCKYYTKLLHVYEPLISSSYVMCTMSEKVLNKLISLLRPIIGKLNTTYKNNLQQNRL